MSTARPARKQPSTIGVLRLEEFLPYRLNVLASTVSQSLARLYDERYGISIPEWRVLATLGQFGTLTAAEIGRHSHMHKTKVSRAVTQMEGKALLHREPNRADMREAFLSLTPEGRAIYEKLAPEALLFARRLVEDLGPTELAMLDSLLGRLTDRARLLAGETAEDDPESA